MPAQSVTIYAFHPDYELGAGLDSVFEDGTLRYLQTEIVNYRYSRVPKQPDPRWPRALVQDDYIALAPAPLAPDQAHHEYPATLHDVPLGVGQLPVFPLWRRGDAPNFEGGPARAAATPVGIIARLMLVRLEARFRLFAADAERTARGDGQALAGEACGCPDANQGAWVAQAEPWECACLLAIQHGMAASQYP